MRRRLLISATAAALLAVPSVTTAAADTGCTTRFEQLPAAPATPVWWVEVEECPAPVATKAVQSPKPAKLSAVKPPAKGSVKGPVKVSPSPKPLRKVSSTTVRTVSGSTGAPTGVARTGASGKTFKSPATSGTSSTGLRGGKKRSATSSQHSVVASAGPGVSWGAVASAPVKDSVSEGPVPSPSPSPAGAVVKELARTGSSPWLGLGLAAVLTTLGSGAVVWRRRQEV